MILSFGVQALSQSRYRRPADGSGNQVPIRTP